MGERLPFQPLTKRDKITVVLYRTGIALSAIIISIFAFMSLNLSERSFLPLSQAKGIAWDSAGLKFNILLISLHVSVGLSVFFIHLYVSKFKRMLIRLYSISAAALILLFILGKGNVLEIFISKPYGPLLLIPLSGCLGFIAAKEAFCFKLMEGYIIALIMPLYLLSLATGSGALRAASYGLVLIAVMLLFFTFRKIFQPLYYDIGDKSAYR